MISIVDNSFSLVFIFHDQSLISGRETGHCALPPTNFEIFQIFSSFLRSKVFSCSAIREANHIQSLLYQKSSSTLLVANQTYTKILHCFIKLFLWMPGKQFLLLSVSLVYNDWNFFNSPIFLKNESSIKKYLQPKIKVVKCPCLT